MEAPKKKLKDTLLPSLFHTKKRRTRRHHADSGHDEGLNSTPPKTPSIVVSASAPILSELKRGSKTKTPSSLTASQQIQLLSVSSPSLSHEPSRTRSTSRISSASSFHTDNQSISMRSAYSNGDDMVDDQAPSIIRSDRVHRYDFETPTYRHEDGASSRFSYNANHLKSSSSSSLQEHQQGSQSTPRFLLKRPYFSSSFHSFHRRKSSSQINNNRDNVSILSSSNSRRVSRSNVLFLGRSLPDFETLVYCSACEKWIHSRLRYRSGAMVWLAAFVLLICTVIFFWIPFYTKYFKDTIHYCPSCGCQVGRHNAL